MSYLINWESLYASETSLRQEKGQSPINEVTGSQNPPHHHQGKHYRIFGGFDKLACWQDAYGCGLIWLSYPRWPAFTGLVNSGSLEEKIAGNSAFFSNLSGFFEFCFDAFFNDFPGTFHIKHVPGLKSMPVPKERLQGAEKCLGSLVILGFLLLPFQVLFLF